MMADVDLDQLSDKLERYIDQLEGTGCYVSPLQLETIYAQIQTVQTIMTEGTKNTRLNAVTAELHQLLVKRYFH
jgi:hypothetical protein